MVNYFNLAGMEAVLLCLMRLRIHKLVQTSKGRGTCVMIVLDHELITPCSLASSSLFMLHIEPPGRRQEGLGTQLEAFCDVFRPSTNHLPQCHAQ